MPRPRASSRSGRSWRESRWWIESTRRVCGRATGLRGRAFRAAGARILARHDATMYVVHPFLFDVASRRVRLDWENVEHRWIRPADELDRFQTVPRLKDVVAAVLR